MSTLGAVLGTVKFNVEADTKNAEEGMDRVKEKGKGLGGALADIGKNAAGVFAGMMAVQGFTSLPGLFTSMADAAREDEAEVTRVGQSLKNLAAATGGGAPQIAKWTSEVKDAEEKGRNLAFTNTEMRNSFTFLVDATSNTEDALKRQTLAMDFARGANIPLQKASMLLGKVTEANVEQFKKLGIHIGKGATEAQAFAAIQAKFGGQADAYAKSSAGQMEIAKIKFAELKIEIGYALLPVIDLLTKAGLFLANIMAIVIPLAIAGVTTAVNWLKDKAELLEAPLKRIGALVWDKLQDAFERVKGPLIELYTSAKQFIELSWDKIQSVWETMAPYIAKVAGFTFKELIALGSVAWNKLQDAWKVVGPWLEKVGKLSYKELVELGKIAWDKLQKAWEVIGPGAVNFGKSMAGMDWKGMGGGLADIGDKLVKFLGPATLGAFKALLDAVKPLAPIFVDELLPALLQLGTALEPQAKVVAVVIVLAFRALLEIIQLLLPVVGVILVGAFHEIAIVIEGFAGVVTGITTVLQGVIDFIVGIFTGDWDRAWTGIKEIFSGVWTIFSTIIETAWALVVNTVKTLLSAFNALFKGFFTDTLPGSLANVGNALLDAGKDLLRGIKDGAVEGYETVKQWFADLPENIWKALLSLGALELKLLKGGKNLLKGLLDGALEKAVDLFEWVGKLPGYIVEKLGDLGSLFAGVGQSMVDGILAGVKAAWGGLVNWMKEEAKALPGQIIHAIVGGSPALLFTPPGASMVQGIAKGVTDEWPMLSHTITGLAMNAATVADTAVLMAVRGSVQGLAGGATAVPGDTSIGSLTIRNTAPIDTHKLGYYDAVNNLTWVGGYWQQGQIQPQDLGMYSGSIRPGADTMVDLGNGPQHSLGYAYERGGALNPDSRTRKSGVTISVSQTFHGPVNSDDLRKANDDWWEKKIRQEFGYNAFVSGVKGAA